MFEDEGLCAGDASRMNEGRVYSCVSARTFGRDGMTEFSRESLSIQEF